MSIQSINGAADYPTTHSAVVQPAKSSTGASYSSFASAPQTAGETFSDAAHKLVVADSGTTQHRTRAQEQYLRSAYSDRASAEKLASEMAEGNSTICYNIRDVPVDQAGILLASGRIIDENFKRNFYADASKIDAGRRQIYESETAKGTNPVQIIAKMLDFTNSQSKDYLEAAGQLDRIALASQS